jgi:hypothetical protein
MPAISTLFGLVLVALGAYGYLSAEEADRSVTALIPAFFGLPIALLAAIALVRPGARKLTMHLVVLLALLGAIGAGMQGLPKFGALISDPDSLERPTAVLMQSIMTGVCALLVLLGVLSFIKARKKQKAAA